MKHPSLVLRIKLMNATYYYCHYYNNANTDAIAPYHGCFFLLTEEKKLTTPSEYGLESHYSSPDSRNAPFFVDHASLKRPMYAL